MRLSRFIALVASVGLAAPAAAVTPHAMFGDHMVFQRNAPLPIWGTADPGEEIYVHLTVATADGKREEGKAVTAGKDGAWAVQLAAFPAGTDGVLTVKGTDKKDDKGKPVSGTLTFKNVLVGEVWVCSGQSNMEWSLASSPKGGGPEAAKGSTNPNLRLFTVPKHAAATPQAGFLKTPNPQDSKWLVSGPDTTPRFSAVAYFFGRDLQKALGVPVGLIHTSWGGTPAEAWTSTEALTADPTTKHYVEKGKALAGNPNSPASLYNGMIQPLLPFAVKGAIWYQGESNAGRAIEYRTLFATMIEDWRKRWGSDLAFYAVQLAPFEAGNKDADSWAYLREAQAIATAKVKNAGVAVITDVGDLKDIHPQKKEPVGVRLSLLARAQTYGEKVVDSGPAYKSLAVDGDKAVLTFDHIGGGLVAEGGDLKGFTVAGEDKVFHPAKAVIVGDTVVVTSGDVAKPVAVRFGWKNFPELNFFNKAGLPASPFRTDTFPGGK